MSEVNKTRLSSTEVLSKVIELLKNEDRSMNVKEILSELNDGSEVLITEGQVLNIQTKAKNNKILSLKVIKDDNGHLMLSTSSNADNLCTFVNSQFNSINENIMLLKSKLSNDDKKRIVDLMTTKLEKSISALN